MIEFTEKFYLEKIWNRDFPEINGDKEEPAWEFVLKYLKDKAIRGYVYTKQEIVRNLVKETNKSEKTIYAALKKLLRERKLLMQLNPMWPKFLVPTGLTEADLFIIKMIYVDTLKELSRSYLRQIYFDTKEDMLIRYNKIMKYLNKYHPIESS